MNSLSLGNRASCLTVGTEICSAVTKKNNERCKKKALKGSTLCFFHSGKNVNAGRKNKGVNLDEIPDEPGKIGKSSPRAGRKSPRRKDGHSTDRKDDHETDEDIPAHLRSPRRKVSMASGRSDGLLYPSHSDDHLPSNPREDGPGEPFQKKLFSLSSPENIIPTHGKLIDDGPKKAPISLLRPRSEPLETEDSHPPEKQQGSRMSPRRVNKITLNELVSLTRDKRFMSPRRRIGRI